MVLSSKHQDGFSQFDSRLSDYDIMATPYGRDIVKRFVDACHTHGMKIGLFHSRGSSSALQMPVDGSEQEMHAPRLYWLGAHLHSLQGEEYSWFVP